jgi:hypothetical protein
MSTNGIGKILEELSIATPRGGTCRASGFNAHSLHEPNAINSEESNVFHPQLFRNPIWAITLAGCAGFAGLGWLVRRRSSRRQRGRFPQRIC